MACKKYLVVFSTALVVVLLDQLSKLFFKTTFSVGKTFPVVEGFFHLTHVQNTGAGFGILQGQRLVLIFISLIVVGVILFYLDRIGAKERLLQVLVGFLLGGTVGNLIDRAFFGFVVDFLDFRIWPVFNLADTFVTMGIVGMIIYLWNK